MCHPGSDAQEAVMNHHENETRCERSKKLWCSSQWIKGFCNVFKSLILMMLEQAFYATCMLSLKA